MAKLKPPSLIIPAKPVNIGAIRRITNKLHYGKQSAVTQKRRGRNEFDENELVVIQYWADKVLGNEMVFKEAAVRAWMDLEPRSAKKVRDALYKMVKYGMEAVKDANTASQPVPAAPLGDDPDEAAVDP